jgi:GH24 family phage-related lysozyme (muramidase)
MAITNETMANLDPSIDRRLAVDLDASESDKLTAYLDTKGNWTCGRGHLMPRPAAGRSWEGFTVIQSTSDRWFSDDILNAIRLASKWPELASCDTDCRQNALYELAFNMGGRWEQFGPTRAAITAKEWQTVHDHLLESAWAKEVQPDGLDKPGRATRIANYFLSGGYPS